MVALALATAFKAYLGAMVASSLTANCSMSRTISRCLAASIATPLRVHHSLASFFISCSNPASRGRNSAYKSRCSANVLPWPGAIAGSSGRGWGSILATGGLPCSVSLSLYSDEASLSYRSRYSMRSAMLTITSTGGGGGSLGTSARTASITSLATASALDVLLRRFPLRPRLLRFPVLGSHGNAGGGSPGLTAGRS